MLVNDDLMNVIRIIAKEFCENLLSNDVDNLGHVISKMNTWLDPFVDYNLYVWRNALWEAGANVIAISKYELKEKEWNDLISQVKNGVENSVQGISEDDEHLFIDSLYNLIVIPWKIYFNLADEGRAKKEEKPEEEKKE